jgi:hypothetical protein
VLRSSPAGAPVERVIVLFRLVVVFPFLIILGSAHWRLGLIALLVLGWALLAPLLRMRQVGNRIQFVSRGRLHRLSRDDVVCSYSPSFSYLIPQTSAPFVRIVDRRTRRVYPLTSTVSYTNEALFSKHLFPIAEILQITAPVLLHDGIGGNASEGLAIEVVSMGLRPEPGHILTRIMFVGPFRARVEVCNLVVISVDDTNRREPRLCRVTVKGEHRLSTARFILM